MWDLCKEARWIPWLVINSGKAHIGSLCTKWSPFNLSVEWGRTPTEWITCLHVIKSTFIIDRHYQKKRQISLATLFLMFSSAWVLGLINSISSIYVDIRICVNNANILNFCLNFLCIYNKPDPSLMQTRVILFSAVQLWQFPLTDDLAWFVLYVFFFLSSTGI